MTLAQAMEEQKRGGGRVSTTTDHHTPPTIDFLRNSNTSNHMHCNGLSTTAMGSSANAAPPLADAPAVAVTNPAAPVSMVKRVMKRAGEIFFSRAASPTTKIAAGKVCAQLSWEDVVYTSIVDVYKEEKNSQKLFQYCLMQSTLE